MMVRVLVCWGVFMMVLQGGAAGWESTEEEDSEEVEIDDLFEDNDDVSYLHVDSKFYERVI